MSVYELSSKTQALLVNVSLTRPLPSIKLTDNESDEL